MFFFAFLFLQASYSTMSQICDTTFLGFLRLRFFSEVEVCTFGTSLKPHAIVGLHDIWGWGLPLRLRFVLLAETSCNCGVTRHLRLRFATEVEVCTFGMSLKPHTIEVFCGVTQHLRLRFAAEVALGMLHDFRGWGLMLRLRFPTFGTSLKTSIEVFRGVTWLLKLSFASEVEVWDVPETSIEVFCGVTWLLRLSFASEVEVWDVPETSIEVFCGVTWLLRLSFASEVEVSDVPETSIEVLCGVTWLEVCLWGGGLPLRLRFSTFGTSLKTSIWKPQLRFSVGLHDFWGWGLPLRLRFGTSLKPKLRFSVGLHDFQVWGFRFLGRLKKPQLTVSVDFCVWGWGFDSEVKVWTSLKPQLRFSLRLRFLPLRLRFSASGLSLKTFSVGLHDFWGWGLPLRLRFLTIGTSLKTSIKVFCGATWLLRLRGLHDRLRFCDFGTFLKISIEVFCWFTWLLRLRFNFCDFGTFLKTSTSGYLQSNSTWN